MRRARRMASPPGPRSPVTLTLTGARSELGAVLRRRVAERPQAGELSAHLNLAGQHANTLLHDGHAWADFPHRLLDGTRRALRAARAAGAPRFVHASFAFVRAVEAGEPLAGPLRADVDAILAAEAMVLAGPVPACVVRLGYLYGPHSADLRAYRSAFRLGRPYWAGEPGALQHHLHQHDAADALLAAARGGRAGRIVYATDDEPTSFRTFMDAFARRVGRRCPLHLPLRSRPLVRALIREQHVQQTALAMPPGLPSPRPARWRPAFADHGSGLDQVIDAWRAAPTAS